MAAQCPLHADRFRPPPQRLPVRVPDGAATIALVGDSHASHWRGALAFVAQAKGRRGYSLSHRSCPLQKARRDVPRRAQAECERWKADVFAWFAAHPEVDTVFVAGLTGGSGVVPSGGRSRFETAVNGYAEAWAALPASVRRIVVIRDTPSVAGDTDRCVARAASRRSEAGTECAVTRTRSLKPDPAIVAARWLGDQRQQTVDLTPFFCDSRCYPVIGGALVLRDTSHMTDTYATSLGPYLLRAVDRLMVR